MSESKEQLDKMVVVMSLENAQEAIGKIMGETLSVLRSPSSQAVLNKYDLALTDMLLGLLEAKRDVGLMLKSLNKEPVS